MKWILIKV